MSKKWGDFRHSEIKNLEKESENGDKNGEEKKEKKLENSCDFRL